MISFENFVKIIKSQEIYIDDADAKEKYEHVYKETTKFYERVTEAVHSVSSGVPGSSIVLQQFYQKDAIDMMVLHDYSNNAEINRTFVSMIVRSSSFSELLGYAKEIQEAAAMKVIKEEL